jgi:hypothetical protein
VGSLGGEELNVVIFDVGCVELVDEVREDFGSGSEAGGVVDEEEDRLFAAGGLTEERSGDGMGDTLAECSLVIGIGEDGGAPDTEEAVVGDVHGLDFFIERIGEGDLHVISQGSG